MAEVTFLFGNELIAEVEYLIKNAKHRLLLVSPFIDLDRRIQDALLEKKRKHDFELLVLFGKNENNIYKSIKKDSLDFLKKFPNIEIRYNDRLHAKFYQNDFDYIMTSLNLYDYSLAKNIEIGIISNYASKGIVGKLIDGADNIIAQGTDKMKEEFLGRDKEINPIEEIQKIFENSELKYKTKPIIISKGVLNKKELKGFDVLKDELSIKTEGTKKGLNLENVVKKDIIKTFSASQLSKSLGISQNAITNKMEKSGLTKNGNITKQGISKGLIIKSYMGKDYIAYPENLIELNDLTE